jgi:hypothetical protein
MYSKGTSKPTPESSSSDCRVSPLAVPTNRTREMSIGVSVGRQAELNGADVGFERFEGHPFG